MKPNVNNVKLGELYTFSQDLTLQSASMSDLLSHLERVCGIDCPSDLSTELPLVIDELADMEPKRHVRGKYELWFFIKFIEKLIAVLQAENEESGQSLKIRTQIGETNAVEILGPRVQMPKSLREFFRSNGLSPI